MRKLLLFSLADLRSSYRDPMLKTLFFIPLIVLAVIYWVIPLLVRTYPGFSDYTLIILMLACLQTASLFGFVYGFLTLEEKEEELWKSLKILPVNGLLFISSRLILGFLSSAVFIFLLLHITDIVDLSWQREILISLQFSLLAPLMALLLGSVAQNKIEGFAQVKILNIVLLLPIIPFLISSKWFHLFAMIPSYWSFQSLDPSKSEQSFAFYLLIGILVYLIYIFIFNRRLWKVYQG